MNPAAQMITCGIKIIKNNSKKVITQKQKLNLTLENILFGFPATNARFFHKSLFQRFGKFNVADANKQYIIANDRDFLINLALNNIEYEMIELPLYIYHAHSGSLTFSNKYAEKICKEHIQIAKTHLTNNKLDNNQRNLLNKWLIQEWLRLSWIQLKNRKLYLFMASIYHGLEENPLSCCWQGIIMSYHWFGKKLGINSSSI